MTSPAEVAFLKRLESSVPHTRCRAQNPTSCRFHGSPTREAEAERQRENATAFRAAVALMREAQREREEDEELERQMNDGLPASLNTLLSLDTALKVSKELGDSVGVYQGERLMLKLYHQADLPDEDKKQLPADFVEWADRDARFPLVLNAEQYTAFQSLYWTQQLNAKVGYMATLLEKSQPSTEAEFIRAYIKKYGWEPLNQSATILAGANRNYTLQQAQAFLWHKVIRETWETYALKEPYTAQLIQEQYPGTVVTKGTAKDDRDYGVDLEVRDYKYGHLLATVQVKQPSYLHIIGKRPEIARANLLKAHKVRERQTYIRFVFWDSIQKGIVAPFSAEEVHDPATAKKIAAGTHIPNDYRLI